MTMMFVFCLGIALLPLILLGVMWRKARSWQGNRWVFRAIFALQLALLSPTLLLAGNGALPVPTLGGLLIIAWNFPWQEGLMIDLLLFGSENGAIVTAPFLLVFIIALFLPWPRLPTRALPADVAR